MIKSLLLFLGRLRRMAVAIFRILKIVLMVALVLFVLWFTHHMLTNAEFRESMATIALVIFGFALILRMFVKVSPPPYDDWVERKQRADMQKYVPKDKF